MKSLFYTFLFLFPAVPALAQTPVADSLIVRGETIYYIDGVKVRKSAQLTGTIVKEEDITVIIGGLPVNYGDIGSSIIRIANTKIPPRKPTVPDKEQKMATE
ncbi:hypothetical protein [Fluviicola sp.]|uniref:hypothetical protein n=1 Tax=Fluviicola sp. TaxID=1917219 RepID=UPI0031E33ED7